MKVTVRTLDSNSFEFDIENEEITVREFKEMIAEKVKVSAEIQRIIFKGKVLQDAKLLKEYGVNGCVLHLVQKPPPSSNTAGQTTAEQTSASAGSFRPPSSGPHIINGATQVFVGQMPTTTDLNGMTQQIVNSLVGQFGAGNVQTNSFSSNLGGGSGDSVNVEINVETTPTIQLSAEVRQLNNVNRFMQRAMDTLNAEDRPSTSEASSEDAPMDTDATETTTPDQSEPTAASSDSFSTIPPLTSTTDSDEPADPRKMLAQSYQRMLEVNSLMRPQVERYLSALNNESSDISESDRALPARLAESVHNMSHALHALSDVSYSHDQPNPVTLFSQQSSASSTGTTQTSTTSTGTMPTGMPTAGTQSAVGGMMIPGFSLGGAPYMNIGPASQQNFRMPTPTPNNGGQQSAPIAMMAATQLIRVPFSGSSSAGSDAPMSVPPFVSVPLTTPASQPSSQGPAAATQTSAANSSGPRAPAPAAAGGLPGNMFSPEMMQQIQQGASQSMLSGISNIVQGLMSGMTGQTPQQTPSQQQPSQSQPQPQRPSEENALPNGERVMQVSLDGSMESSITGGSHHHHHSDIHQHQHHHHHEDGTCCNEEVSDPHPHTHGGLGGHAHGHQGPCNHSESSSEPPPTFPRHVPAAPAQPPTGAPTAPPTGHPPRISSIIGQPNIQQQVINIPLGGQGTLGPFPNLGSMMGGPRGPHPDQLLQCRSFHFRNEMPRVPTELEIRTITVEPTLHIATQSQSSPISSSMNFQARNAPPQFQQSGDTDPPRPAATIPIRPVRPTRESAVKSSDRRAGGASSSSQDLTQEQITKLRNEQNEATTHQRCERLRQRNTYTRMRAWIECNLCMGEGPGRRDDTTFSRFIKMMNENISLPEMMEMVLGPDNKMFWRLQGPLNWFIRGVFNNDEFMTEEDIPAVADQLIDVIQDITNEVVGNGVNIKDDIDLVATLRELDHQELLKLLACLQKSRKDWCDAFPEWYKEYLGKLFAILDRSVVGGASAYFHAMLTLRSARASMGSIDPMVGNLMLEVVNGRMRSVANCTKLTDNEVNAMLVRVKRPDTRPREKNLEKEEVYGRAAKRTKLEEKWQKMRDGEHSSESENDDSPPRAEEWHAHVPSDWIKVIKKDEERQATTNNQRRPFSDAYLNGLPASRRSLLTSHSQSADRIDLPTLVTRAARVARVEPSTDNQDIQRDIEESSLEEEFLSTFRHDVSQRLKTEKDYRPDRHAAVDEYILKKRKSPDS